MLKILIDQTLPCWSKMLWTPSPASVSFLIHQDILPILDSLTKDHHRISHYLEYGPFIHESDHWGIDGSLEKIVDTNSDFIEFRIPIPRVKSLASESCSSCNGTGEDLEFQFACISCQGTGHPIDYDWKSIHAISASIAILTDSINHFPPEENTSSTQIQLMSPVGFKMRDAHPLFGQMSRELVNWFRSNKDTILSEPTNAVRIAWRTMMNEPDDFNSYTLEVIIRDEGRFHISCPGDACEIFPDPMIIDETRGYEFTCHNLDSPIQQLTLLAGLASLEMQARKELNL